MITSNCSARLRCSAMTFRLDVQARACKRRVQHAHLRRSSRVRRFPSANHHRLRWVFVAATAMRHLHSAMGVTLRQITTARVVQVATTMASTTAQPTPTPHPRGQATTLHRKHRKHRNAGKMTHAGMETRSAMTISVKVTCPPHASRHGVIVAAIPGPSSKTAQPHSRKPSRATTIRAGMVATRNATTTSAKATFSNRHAHPRGGIAATLLLRLHRSKTVRLYRRNHLLQYNSRLKVAMAINAGIPTLAEIMTQPSARLPSRHSHRLHNSRTRR